MMVSAAVRVAVTMIAMRVIIAMRICVTMLVIVVANSRRRQTVGAQPRDDAEHEQGQRNDRERKRRKPERYWSHAEYVRC